MYRRHVVATVAALIACARGGLAQTAAPVMRIRGRIAAVNGNMLTVDSRDGRALGVTLFDPPTVLAVRNVDLSTITANSYVGIATRMGPDGKMVALEVLVFPEASRGAGEGHYPWDLEPGSMMTNGTVSGVVTSAAGRELSVRYKDSSKTIVVPPGVPVVTFVPASRSDLKPGATVFLNATLSPEGTPTASRVVVGKDGVAPPM